MAITSVTEWVVAPSASDVPEFVGSSQTPDKYAKSDTYTISVNQDSMTCERDRPF